MFGEHEREIGNQVLCTAGVGAVCSLNRNVRVSTTYDLLSRSFGRGATLGPSGQGFGCDYTHRVMLQVKLAL